MAAATMRGEASRRGRRLLAVGLCLAALCWPGVEAGKRLVLARVDGQPVTLEDIQLEFERRHSGHMGLIGDEAVVRDFLTAVIRRRLFTQEGRRMRLQEQPEIRERVRAERERLAAQWLYETEVADRATVSDAQLEEALRQMRHTLEVVVVQTDTAEQAARARERVAAGEPAGQVAREVSIARSGSRGGVETLVWGRRSAAVEAAALATPVGELTPVLPEADGWLFLAVVDRREADLADPEAARGRAREVLRQRQQDALRDRYLDELRRRYRARVDESLLDPAVLAPLVADPSVAQGDDRAVAEFDGGRITLAELVKSIRAEAFLGLRPEQQRLQASRLLSDRLDQELLRREGLARWERVPEEKKARARDVEDDLIFRALLATVVFADLEVGDEEIRSWYEEHREDYVDPVRIQLAIALLDSEAEARTLLEEARAGGSFAELARARSRDAQTARQGGVAGWVTEDKAIAELRGEPFRAAAGTLGGPVRIETGWLVYKVLDRREATPLAEQQVRERIRPELMERKSRQRMEEWEERLRAAATIKIDEASIREAGRRLDREFDARSRPRQGHAPAAAPRGHP